MNSQPSYLEGEAVTRPRQSATRAERIRSLDALRGAVMIIMALDHVRDFFHRGAMSFSATDLSRTTPAIFWTRWITHFCMPVFMFTAGMSAFLWLRRNDNNKGALARFLLTRGMWFVFLEITVMQFSYDFDVSRRNTVLLLVLWIFGLCMIIMSGLIWLRLSALAVLSVAVIVFHNCLDPISMPVWLFLHRVGVFQVAGISVLVTYPIIPWVAVVAAGFCFGRVLLLDPRQRRKVMFRLGVGLTVAFVALRVWNGYGDPAPRVAGVLSFFNCTKYPASLDFLLMTLGPALIVFSLLDRLRFGASNPLVVFGRVPFFYFVLHMFLIHAVLVVFCLLRYGGAAFGFIFHPVPSFGGPAALFPHDFGFRLRTVYLVWIAVVAMLYRVCLWFSRYKATHTQWWLKYL